MEISSELAMGASVQLSVPWTSCRRWASAGYLSGSEQQFAHLGERVVPGDSEIKDEKMGGGHSED